MQSSRLGLPARWRTRYSKVWSARPLGTRAGISFRRFSGLARGSSSPSRTNSTSCRNSSGDRLIGTRISGSSRSKSGAIGPTLPRRSAATPAAAGS